MISLNLMNSDSGSGLVNMSAGWSFDFTDWMSIIPFSTCSIKCQYLMFICLVLGLNLGTAAIVFAPVLSSNTLHLKPNAVSICSISKGWESSKLPSLLRCTFTPRYSSISPSSVISNFSYNFITAASNKSDSLLAMMQLSVYMIMMSPFW